MWHTAGDFSVSSVETSVSAQRTEPATAQEGEDSSLSADELEILKLLGKDRVDDLKAEQIGQALRMSEERAWYHLETLRDANYVTQTINLITGHRWSLSQKGRAYLFKRGLLT